MERRWTVIALILALTAAGFAQTGPAAGSPPSREEVLKFVELLHLKAQLMLFLEGTKKQARTGAEEGFRQKVPDATPEQLAKVDQLVDTTFKDLPIDEMLEAMVPIYQKHLTKSDLAAIISFYSSPVGQKLLKEQPAMMAEGMQAGGEIGRRRIGAMSQQLDLLLNDLAMQEQQKKESGAPKKDGGATKK